MGRIFLFGNSDRITGTEDFIYIGRDITERKQQEIEIRRSFAKEQEFRQVKSRFFFMIAHEFGNPLHTILFATKILQDYGDEITHEEKKQYLEHVKSASKHMAQLLDDVPVFSAAPKPENSNSIPHQLTYTNFAAS